MILLPFASGKTYGVVGLGKSGRATVASLLASGATVMAWDDQEASRLGASKEFPGMNLVPLKAWDYTPLAALILSPGILLTHPAVVAAKRHHIEVIGDIELLFRAQPKAQYIAITGTNGKSTTTTLIAHILKSYGKRIEAGGNLGIPALALEPLDAAGTYVLELSSYQLDLVTTTHFQTALLLNISPDHLDHHGSMEHYIAAKQQIFARMDEKNVAIIGVDDVASKTIYQTMLEAKTTWVIPIGVTQIVHDSIYVKHGMLHNALDQLDADIGPITSLRGEHNWQNAAAAYAACLVNGCAHEAIVQAMQSYPGLAHRMEFLGSVHGVQFVNDSKATNADAAEKALKTYDHIYWIIGGVAKEGGIASLADYFPKIRHAYTIGEAAKDFEATLKGHVAVTHCNTLDKAFAAASADAAKAGAAPAVVLLSPACASFDQFPNFEARGQAFVRLFEAFKTGDTHAATA